MYVKSKIRIRLNDGNGELLLMALFLTTFYLYRDLGITTLIGWGIILLFSLLNIVIKLQCNLSVRLSFERIAYLFITIIIGLFFLRLSSRHDADERLYIIAMLVMAVVVFVAEPSLSEIVKTCKVFKVMSCLIAMWILFFKVFPNIYWATVYKFIDVACKQLAAYYVPRGYGIPLGGSFTIAYYIMTVGILIMFVEVVSGKRQKENVIGTALIILAMIAEGRRGELIAVIFALLFLFLLSKDTTHFLMKITVIIIGIVIIMAFYKRILEYAESIPFLSRYVKSIQGIMMGADITSGRTELWRTAWELFKENSIFGIGFGGFAYHISGSFRSIHGQDVMDVHNCTLQLLCENGIIGTVILMIPMLLLFIGSYHRMMTIKKQMNLNIFYEYAFKIDAVAFGIQIFFFILSQLDPAFYKPVFWGFYGFSIILMYGARKLISLGKTNVYEERKKIENK
ncbi:O-antigen ligase family protein [Blautia massiliensis (ex Durand et al. 2017)]|uniref:O-antigen ligase family protein n=1 Tax=Blautia massiliensis (ex Durand et al. 2017) TaxID=1737424 RepID=UPI0022E5B016|nr:O-antigen ligase family protein [Blautia massiliensis (ex Durand et al. 2017)]